MTSGSSTAANGVSLPRGPTVKIAPSAPEPAGVGGVIVRSFELGEIDAAQLWRTEATMAMLRINLDGKQKQFSDQQRSAPIQDEDWSPRLVEDMSRPSWSGRTSAPGLDPPAS